ncbi:hypothetical protein D3C87_2162600 [compost metagenome]
MPSTMYRWKVRNTAKTGSRERADMAKTAPQSVSMAGLAIFLIARETVASFWEFKYRKGAK